MAQLGNNMKTYLYRATFSSSVLDHIIRVGGGLEPAMRVSVEAFGGQVVRCHLRASSVDPIGFLMFPDDISARAWNAFYKMQPGVSASVIERMLDEGDLASLARIVTEAGASATSHRTAD